MLTVDQYAVIRRKHFIDGLSQRAIAAELGHSRKTVSKALQQPTPPDYQQRQPREKPVIDPVKPIIDGWLDQDRRRPPKQRHTAQRIYDDGRQVYKAYHVARPVVHCVCRRGGAGAPRGLIGTDRHTAIILMGASGCGKTTIAHQIADRLGSVFHDADDDHPRENIEKTARGEALTEADRAPWLDAVRARIRAWLESGQGVVLTCSGLTIRPSPLFTCAARKKRSPRACAGATPRTFPRTCATASAPRSSRRPERSRSTSSAPPDAIVRAILQAIGGKDELL